MRRDEFVEIHGEGAWEAMVAPRQHDGRWPVPEKNNVNALVDAEIALFIDEQGLQAPGLVAAQIEWEAVPRDENWSALLLRTLYSPAYYDRMLQHSQEVFASITR